MKTIGKCLRVIHIDDFLQSENDFVELTPSLSLEEECFDENQVHETELSYTTDITNLNIFIQHNY